MNIGLRGSHAQKEPRKWWSSPDAFPEKRLHLNIAAVAEDNEGGLTYDFRFLAEGRAHNSEGHHWFPVSQILEFGDASEIFEYVQDSGLAMNRHAFKTLTRLHTVVHGERLIAYFEETSQDLDKVLNVFIRTNSGGTVLSYSDLLLSIATAQWNQIDARKEIHALVDELNATRFGFALSKDFVLIARVLKVTVQLVAAFGFSGQTLGADNALFSIACSIDQRGLDASYLTSSTFRDDCATLRELGSSRFPVEALEATMRSRGKGLRFDEEEIEDLVDVSCGDRRVFPLLSLLFPFHDLRNEFHVDHVFPRSRDWAQAPRRVPAHLRLQAIHGTVRAPIHTYPTTRVAHRTPILRAQAGSARPRLAPR